MLFYKIIQHLLDFVKLTPPDYGVRLYLLLSREIKNFLEVKK